MNFQKLKKLFSPSGFKIGLLLTALSLIIYFMGFPFLNVLEAKFYDLHFRTRGPVQPGSEVVIVGIDEKSVDLIGRWPWPRTRIAELVDRLNAYGAKVVAFDIVFAEPDESSGSATLRDLQTRVRDRDALAEIETAAAAADNDSRFAASLGKYGNAVLGYFFYTSREEIKHRKENKSGLQDYRIPSRYTSIRSLAKDTPPPAGPPGCCG